ncbi:MAG: AbiH family protein [Prevotella sp.]|nr:AbiH family protein [Prevotella sp.]
MNILYILGNGFDKAQGMATSYPEFYKYLMDNTNNGSELLQQLKKDIKEDKELWSDMEEAFGVFTQKIKNIEIFDDFYFELSELLQEYLKSEEGKFLISQQLKDKFKSDFISVSGSLSPLDKIRFSNYRNIFGGDNEIYVITLNYTNTLEKLLDNKISERRFDNRNILHGVIHLHGTLDNSIIIGVDNEEQIANKELCKDEDVKDLLIKNQSNIAMKQTRQITCESWIENANLIILYGVSLGNTDIRWWNLIGNQLKKRNTLAIIQHLYTPGAITPTTRQKIGKLERTQIANIKERMGINKEDDSNDNIKNRLFFTVNSNIFKL